LEVVEFSCFVLPICLFLEPMPLLPNKNNAYYVNFTHQHQHCYVPPPKKKTLYPSNPGLLLMRRMLCPLRNAVRARKWYIECWPKNYCKYHYKLRKWSQES
jgi:hypothetical protein